MLFIIKSFE